MPNKCLKSTSADLLKWNTVFGLWNLKILSNASVFLLTIVETLGGWRCFSQVLFCEIQVGDFEIPTYVVFHLPTTVEWLGGRRFFTQVFICEKSKTVFPANPERPFLFANVCTSWNRPTTRVYTQCRQGAKLQINFIYLTSVTCAKSAENIPPLGIDQTLCTRLNQNCG